MFQSQIKVVKSLHGTMPPIKQLTEIFCWIIAVQLDAEWRRNECKTQPYLQIADTLVFQRNQEVSWEPGTGQSTQPDRNEEHAPPFLQRIQESWQQGECTAEGREEGAPPEEMALKATTVEQKDTQAGILTIRSWSRTELEMMVLETWNH